MSKLYIAISPSEGVVTRDIKEVEEIATTRSLRGEAMKKLRRCRFPGDYCKTCRACEYFSSSDTLICQCQNSIGYWEPASSIIVSSCDGKIIDSPEGYLDCDDSN